MIPRNWDAEPDDYFDSGRTFKITRDIKDIPEDVLDRLTESWIKLSPSHQITRWYLNSLIDIGWKGLEEIPSEYIKEK